MLWFTPFIDYLLSKALGLFPICKKKRKKKESENNTI